MYQMTEEEKVVREKEKALHIRIREDAKEAKKGSLRIDDYGPRYVAHRTMLLLWGFVRGFKYKRIERSTREQLIPEGSYWHRNSPELLKKYNFQKKEDGSVVHMSNRPDTMVLHWAWKQYLPEITPKEIDAWLDDPTGAIPAPVRVKKPFVPAAE